MPSSATPLPRFGGLSIQRVILENGRSHTTIHVTSPEDPNLKPDELQLGSLHLKQSGGKTPQNMAMYTDSKTDLRLSHPAIAELSRKLNPFSAKRFPRLLPDELKRVLETLSLEQRPIRVATHQVKEKDAALPADRARQMAADILRHAKQVVNSPKSSVEEVWIKPQQGQDSPGDESDPFHFEPGKVFSFKGWILQRLSLSKPAEEPSYLQASLSWFE